MDWAEPGEEPPAELARQAGVSALVARVLYARGCRDAEAIRHHVNPRPVAEWKIGDIPGFGAALEMVERAFAQGEEICISGGYSAADGVAVALCVDGFRHLGLRAAYRLGEWPSDVGLCLKLEKDLENGGALYLGASGGASVRIDTATMSPLGFLSRAGIWWALLRSLAKAREQPGLEPPGADLIALSTVIDGAPMTGLNRALVLWGLPQLVYRPRPGLAALMFQAKLNSPSTPTNDFIDAALSPRLRAAAHRGATEQGIELLLCREADVAAELAAEVEAHYAKDRVEREEEEEPEVATVEIDAYVGLDELDPALVNEISGLGPFGNGNPKPVFASRKTRLVNPTGTGLSRRHARLVVEDEEGHRLAGVWWRKNPATVPREWGDAAYHLRVDTFRGSERTQLEMIAFRPQSADFGEVIQPPLPFAIEDWRRADDREAVLASLIAGGDGVQIWAEGEEVNTEFRQRRDLQRGAVLAIWTAPPGPAVLRRVLDRVQPLKVVLLSTEAETITPGVFLRRLGGLVKGVIARRGGLFRWMN